MSRQGVRGDVAIRSGGERPNDGVAILPKTEALRYTPRPASPHTVHLVGREGPAERAAKCGVTKGSAWPGEPSDVTLLVDKWCSKCWNRWSRERAEQG